MDGEACRTYHVLLVVSQCCLVSLLLESFQTFTQNGAGKLEGRGGTFPWKLLPRELARRGYVLQHYPENVLMPGEKRDTLIRSKGIHDLSLRERQVFANALKNNLLTVKTITRQRALAHLMASRSPVIIEEAPASHSVHKRGQCWYANG